MSSKWRRFEVLLPLQFNDGRDIPPEWLADAVLANDSFPPLTLPIPHCGGSPWNGCWSLAEIATVEATIDIFNSSSTRMRVWIEPWCSEHFLAVGQRLKLVVEDPVEPTFDVQEQEAETIVWLNRHSSAYILDRGVRRHILNC